MANFDQLKQSVAALIRTNGAEEITGQIMQDVLLTIINSISGGYMFGGVAQHSGNVGNPDYNVFYLAGSGAYTGYGDAINIPNGCYGVFRYNGSWTQDVVDIGVHLTGTIREGETNGVTGDVINTALQQLFNNIMNILDTLTFTYNTPSGQQATKAMLDVIVTPTGGASHVLTTLTLVSATAAAAGLMSAEDKQKVDRMLTDFRSLSFSDTTAVADQATKIVQTLSATLGENPEAITTMTFLAATASKAGLLSAADKAKLDALWSSGYQFVGIATPSTTPVSTTSKIFYIATEAGTYFNSVTVTQGINIIYKSGDAWSVAQVVGIDNEPTAGSDRLVKSGGVFGELALGAVYDVSAKNPTAGPNSDGKWESLSALLSDANLNTLIPTSVRKGGMSIKYVQSSDNKYVQYRLIADGWSTDTDNWSFCGNDVYVDNPEFIEAHTDAKDKILYGVKADGDFYFGAGVPSQIKKEIESNTDNIKINVEHKVDKEEGKSLINEEFANGISYQESSDLSILTDANNRIISRVLSNGKFDFPTQKMSDVEIDDSYVYKMTDNKGRTLFGVKKDMSVDWFINVPQSLVEYVKSLIDSRLTDAYQLNKAQEQNLLAAARYNTTYGKCVQMLLVADSHGGFIGVQRAADVCKNIPSVDAIIHLGDMVGWTPNEVELDEVAATVEILKTSKRPFFVVTGNHDVGTVKDIYFTRTHEQVYTDLVKPMIDNGILSNGEYQTTGDWSERCYYYHDFKTTKIRLIVLYDYDMDLVLDDNEYWEPVAYDSSKGKIQRGTTYTYDPNNPIILNCGEWKNNSFRLKKTVTTIMSSVGVNNYTKGTFPWYKLRSFSYYSKKQMDWLVNVLNTTPDGYGIVIASHQIPVFPATISDNDFSIGSNPQNTYHPNSRVPSDTVMQTALAMKIVNAWKNKTSITERIVVKDTPIQTTLQTGDYLNNLEDGSGKYAYIFNADFSNRQNNNAYFINFIAGHEHCDIIAQSVDYSDLFCLTTTTSNPPFRYKSDMPATENQASPVYDCLTILTWAKDRNIACKWGCTKTIAGVDRNYVKL